MLVFRFDKPIQLPPATAREKISREKFFWEASAEKNLT